ncbi:MAG: DNA gyrase inhibitor YacG [Candidatus Dasytiphilus stammeri]
MINNIQVECPRCGKIFGWKYNQIFRPFCSKSCKNLDLQYWLIDCNNITK